MMNTARIFLWFTGPLTSHGIGDRSGNVQILIILRFFTSIFTPTVLSRVSNTILVTLKDIWLIPMVAGPIDWIEYSCFRYARTVSLLRAIESAEVLVSELGGSWGYMLTLSIHPEMNTTVNIIAASA